jgi:hypothetical protein
MSTDNKSIYDTPDWSGKPSPDNFFTIEILKDGLIIDEIQLNKKSFYIFGRQENVVDVVCEHPSISRRHAVFQVSAHIHHIIA